MKASEINVLGQNSIRIFDTTKTTEGGEKVKKKLLMSFFIMVISIALVSAATMAWFTDSDDAGQATFEAGTVSIEAGRKVVSKEGESGSFDTIEDTFYPVKVADSLQGYDLKDKSVRKDRSNPEAALGSPNASIPDFEDFYSLGFDGWIELEFVHAIYASEMAIVIETTGGNYPTEKAKVFVSDTGEEGDWEFISEASTEDLAGNPKEIRIEISNLNVPYIKYIRFEDYTDPDDFESYSGNTPDGFDLNSVGITGLTQEENNWNPGEENERVYTIINTGANAINLRGEFTGQWYEYNENSKEWEVADDLSSDVVEYKLISDDWKINGDYFYYIYSIPGTYTGENLKNRTKELIVSICLDDPKTGYEYQGKRFIVTATFDAIQASNGAAEASNWYIPTPKGD